MVSPHDCPRENWSSSRRMLAMLRCWHIKSRAAVKKAHRLQRKANHLHRRDRPILGPSDMIGAKGVPDNEIGVLHGTILLHVDRESIVASLLIWVISGSIALSRIVRSDPEVLPDEASTLPLGRSFMEEGKSICPWHELVGNGFTKEIEHRRVNNLPVASCLRLNGALGLGLVGQKCFSRDP